MNKAHTPSKIGVATATIIGLNAMIGAGIFTAPAVIASHVGPAGILAFLFVVASIWFMAVSIARLAYLFPQEGSFYTYAKQWSGHIGGMLAVSAYFIGLLIAMGLLCRLSGTYLQTFFPNYSANTLGLATLCALVALNMFGVKMSELGQHILIFCTVFPLIITTILCLTKASWSNLVPFAPYGFGNAMKATRVVIFGFFGFECATSLFNIVRDPAKNVPRALTYSIILVGIIYTTFIGSIIISTPLSYFTHPDMKISEILIQLFPNYTWIVKFIDFSILAAIIGTIHSMIWASGSLLQIIVKKTQNNITKNIISRGWVSTKTTVLFVGICILFSYTTLHNLNLFFYLTALFIVFAFVMSMVTLLTLKEEWQSQRNIKTVLGIITATAIFAFALEGIVCELI
ncbi:MAG: amino acid permease [Candidatus Dependentiae bacterium]